ncbi:twin-arginine translocation signal domain-containing protein [Haloarcula marina]|uniref:twin-arginine translocation signal domain-containing protein n=2 Tax=Haloarcula marina TaxID=2961574 RepID=UPI0020B7F23D|nr:twin-arginine translocation signal domain-containing protein [Halomicroarcula marina]
MVSNRLPGQVDESTREFSRRGLMKLVGAAGAGLGLGSHDLGGVKPVAAATSSPTIIDDFEDGGLSEYEADPNNSDVDMSGVNVTSSQPKNGSLSLEIDAVEAEFISTSGLNAYPAAGDTFRVWIRTTGGVDETNFTYGVQSHTDRYFVRLSEVNDRVALYRYENDSSTQLSESDSGFSLSPDTWYQIEIDWQTDGTHTVTVYDDTKTQVTQTSATDTTWNSGGIGFDAYIYSSGTKVWYDYAVIGDDSGNGGESSGGLIEGFEHNDLSDYYSFDRGASGASIVNSPVDGGSYALELSGTTTEMINTASLDGYSQLDGYPQPGDTFSYHFRTPDAAGSANFTYGVQDHENRYYISTDFDEDEFYLFTYKSGNSTHLGGESGITYETGVWYEVEITWATDGTHTARLIHPSNGEIASGTMSDSTFTSKGIGFDAYLSSGESVYFDHVTSGLLQKLGMFEDGLDGWTTNGDHQLTQVSESDEPGGVTQGSFGLDVQTGTSLAQIENTQRFQNADCLGAPYLVADVVGFFDNSTADLNLEFRYHRSDGGTTEESPIVRLPQWTPGHATWDLSTLADAALDNPERLELICYPSDQPPDSNFDYTGQLWIDNIRLTDSPTEHSTCAMRTKMTTFKRRFGHMTETIVDNETATVEEGRFVYSDTTEKTYRCEELGEDQYELTIDGEVFEWGGGW